MATKNPSILLNDIPDDVNQKLIEIKIHLMQKTKRSKVSMKEVIFKAIRNYETPNK